MAGTDIVHRLFGSWMAIRLLLVLVLCTAIIILGLSGYQYQTSPGDNNGISDSTWEKSYCHSSPYQYFSPFSFTYQVSGADPTSVAYCGWSASNTAFRLSLSIFSILGYPVLFFDTVVSSLAPLMFLVGTLLWFCVLVLDSESYGLGASACASKFSGTSLQASSSVTVNCSSSTVYLAPVFMDVLIVSVLFILWWVWSDCANLYNGTAKREPREYTYIGGLFGTWFRIKIVLFLVCIGAIVSVILSSIQFQSSEGTTLKGLTTDGWQSTCHGSPYLYISPFSFLAQNSKGATTGSAAYCGWPVANTAFRIALACLSGLYSVVLFFPTLASSVASPTFFLSMWAWAAAFIVDANSFTLGQTACDNDFDGTTIGTALDNDNYTALCSSGQTYVSSVLVDLIFFFLFYILWNAWGSAKDLYDQKGDNTTPLAHK